MIKPTNVFATDCMERVEKKGCIKHKYAKT